jgi:hypothetical protein
VKKLYSIKGYDSDTCQELEYFQEMLKDDLHHASYVLEVWEPKTGTGTFWCSEEGEVFESGTCGAECHAYEPRNGKSGRCRWHLTPFHPTGKTITIEV